MLSKNSRNLLFFITLVLFIVALARPVINKTEHNVKQQLIPIVIALDLSKSMRAADIYPDRISLAKQKLQEIINKGINTTIGIVLFAKDAFILTPVTEDVTSLNFIVKNIDTSFNFPNGSNLFATLQSTKFMLNDYKVKNLIILSDGGNNKNYTKEIEFAKKENIAVYTIGIATKKGAAIPDKGGYLTDKNGKIVTVKLNDSIKELALKTGGGYIEYTLDNSDLDAILDRILTQSKKEDISNQNIVTYTELFYYPLALAVVLLFIGFSSLPSIGRKRDTVVVVFLLSFINPSLMYSFEFDFEKINKAKEHYTNEEYSKAADKYKELSATPQTLYNMANSLYKNGQYQEAIDIYEKVVTEDRDLEAKKLHNMGNGYVKLNSLEKAKQLYEKALKIKEDQQTKENLELVKKELEKKKKQQSKNGNKKENSEDKQQDSKKKKEKDQNKSSNQKKKENKEPSDKNGKNNKQDDAKKENSSNTKEKKALKDKINNQTKQQQRYKENQISKMEEEKWMKQLQQQKTPLFIQKAPTTNRGGEDETPW